MINLDEQELFRTYAQAKQLRIESLLDQYGSSLADMRELYPKLTETIEKQRLVTTLPTQALFFIPSEAAEMGLSLEEGWMLKVSPVEGGYKSSFITPTKWEMTEDELYISPAGEKYSRADLEALLAPPSGLEAEITGIPTIENLNEEGKVAYQEYQQAGGELNVAGWVDLRERQQLETEQVFGAVFPEQDISEVMTYIQENPEGFLADIREVGPTAEVITLLKSLEFQDEQGNPYHLTEADIGDIFGTTITTPTIQPRISAPFPVTPIWATHTTVLNTVGFPLAYGDIPTVEATPLEDAAYVFAGSIKLLPSQIAAAVLQAVQGQGGASVVNKDWADEKIAQANEDLNQFVQKTAAEYPDSQFLLDVSQLSQNLAFSITTMGVGNLAALPLWLAPEPTGGTKLAAAAVAGAVSGYVSFRMVTYQITQQYLEFKDAEQRGQTGQGLTLEQENQLKADFQDKAVRYGLWEAIPEGISNMVFSGILGGAFNNALTKVVGQKIAGQIAGSVVARFGSKAFGIYGEELLTETITQKGQAAIEVEAGLREGNITWAEAFREIAPQTFLLTTIMAGAGQVIVTAGGKIKARANRVENVDKITDSLKTEIGEGNPLYEELKEHIEGEIGKGTITEQDARESLAGELADKLLNEMKIAEQIKPTIAGVTLTPTQYEEGVYAINIEGREGGVGAVVAVIQGDALFVNRISMHEKGVLTRSLLRTIDEQLIVMAQAQGLKSIRIAAKPDTFATYSRAGYVREGDTNVMVKGVPTAEVPITPPGMPEAGLQAGIPGMAAAEVVRPQPTGKLVQAKIDDYLRLREYNAKAVTDRIAEIKKALEKKGRTELGLRGTLALELARLEAQQELGFVKSIEDLDLLIREVENELGRRSLPGQGEWARSGIALARHPRKPNIFPEYTSRQLDEMRNVYLQARENMPAPVIAPIPIPETPPEVINRVKTDPTPASDEIILKKFIDCIKDAKPATEETLALRHKELQKRSAIFASILAGGEGYHAFEQAKSALKGPLPKADWDLDLQKFGITDAEITRMFDRIRLDSKLQPFQKLNTYEALTNLLSGATLTEGEINSLEKVFGSRLAVALIGKLPTGKRVVRILQDITNVPRTLVTIADLSATFRQGALLAFGQPVQFSEAFVAQLKAVFSEKNFRLIDEINHNNPYVASGKLKRLYIAPIGEAVTVEAREEAFRGRLIERLPKWLGIASIVRASERAYITFLNVLRVSVATYYARQWEGTGKTQNDYDKLCDFINHATGRGDLGAFSQAGSWLSAIFFSPRFIMSRVQVPLDLINTTPAVRKVIARNLVSFVGAGMLALFLAKLAGAETEDDPRSADFGKIKIGNTRIDFWGAYLPYVRLITQIITEERKSTKTGEVYKIDPIDVGVNFFRSKLAPVPGFLWDLKAGETFIGEELSAENAEKIIFEKLTPMFIQDLVEAVKDSGIAGIGYGILSGLGIGIQTYSDNWGSAELKLGLPQRGENFPYTIENEVYDVKDYYSEISQMIGGATYDMLKDKNIPDKVLSVAKAKDILREIGFLPNKRLTTINADPTKGDTFEQYRVQWLAREKITNAEELAKFDKDYPDAYLGNITQAQYALLVEYHSLPDSEKAAFLGNHPELYINPREEWLRTHPQENALLVLWGKADIYSPEAQSQVSSLVKSLDIPENALVMKDLDAVSELKLKNQSLFDLVDAYGGLDDTLKGPDGLTARDRAIKQLYLDNPDFREDQRRIEALNVGTKDNPTIESMVEGWVERGKIADEFGSSSPEMKLWLIDNKEVHQWALENGLLSDTGEDWNENILRLEVNYREAFDKYDALGNEASPSYIANDTARADAREAMIFSNDKMTSFGVAYYTINALQKNIPENLVTTYVDYYGTRKKEGVDYSAGWYEDDWYLIEHEDFYDTMLSMGLWQAKDFTKVPTRGVFSLYQTYSTLPKGDARLDFRSQHPDLDKWLVLAKGYTPVGSR